MLQKTVCAGTQKADPVQHKNTSLTSTLFFCFLHQDRWYNHSKHCTPNNRGTFKHGFANSEQSAPLQFFVFSPNAHHLHQPGFETLLGCRCRIGLPIVSFGVSMKRKLSVSNRRLLRLQCIASYLLFQFSSDPHSFGYLRVRSRTETPESPNGTKHTVRHRQRLTPHTWYTIHRPMHTSVIAGNKRHRFELTQATDTIMLCGGGGGVEKLLRARMGAPVSDTRETHRLGKLRDSLLKNQEGTITAASESFFFSRTSNGHFEPSLGREVLVFSGAKFTRHVSRVLVSACVCRFFRSVNATQKYQVTLAHIEVGPVPKSMSHGHGAWSRKTPMVPEMCIRLLQRKGEGRSEAARPQTARASSSNLGDRPHEVFVLVCPPPVSG